MRRLIILICLFLPVSLPASLSMGLPVSRHFRLQRLSDGVWAAIHDAKGGGHAICNAGIIDLGNRTVVFDPFMNLDAAEDLRKAALQLTGRRPAWLVNSHHHNDHVRGNQVFQPANIVSTAATRDGMKIGEPRQLQWERQHAPGILDGYRRQLAAARTPSERADVMLWYAYFEGMVQSGPRIRTTLPDILFSDSLWIHGSRRSVKCIEFRNGHTGSDVVLLLPKEGIVFTGDLFFNEAHPYLGDGDPDALVRHLNRLSSDTGMRCFVPGHGPVGNRASVQRLAVYVDDLQRMVREGRSRGLSDADIQASPMPAVYAGWTFGQRLFEDNLSFLCRRVRM